MATTLKIAKIITVQPIKKHSATLILFHGSGDSASGIKEWIDIINREELKFPHVKIIYPTAPSQPYTPLQGMKSNVWFDRNAIKKKVPENTESINNICKVVSELIDNEMKNGISINRVAVGGFSMGGTLAMHIAYRYRTNVAGCAVMSSFLNDNSLVYEALNANAGEKLPPLLQFHGLQDTLVPFSWGETTHDSLKKFDIKTEFIPIEGIEHELERSEIKKLKQWILQILPEQQ
ncbi:hypothetical protein PV327_003975 [Microctonus hyperodae]|nr:hypothetical protein PV327_003975 [Microctonus hyperodae]